MDSNANHVYKLHSGYHNLCDLTLTATYDICLVGFADGIIWAKKKLPSLYIEIKVENLTVQSSKVIE